MKLTSCPMRRQHLAVTTDEPTVWECAIEFVALREHRYELSDRTCGTYHETMRKSFCESSSGSPMLCGYVKNIYTMLVRLGNC